MPPRSRSLALLAPWALVVLLTITAGITGMTAVRARRDRDAAQRALSNLTRSVRPAEVQPSPSLPPAPEPLPRASAPAPARTPRDGARLDDVRALTRTQDQLAQAQASLAELQDQLREAEGERERAREEAKRLAAAEADARGRHATSQRLADALQAELEAKANRAQSNDAQQRRLTDESRAAAERLTRLSQQMQDLEEINRRRETYLTSILRRYREVTDLYRALALRLDSPTRDVPIAPSNLDLSRIQQAITMADEDLRQLQNLNAQARTAAQRLKAP